jgi:DNA-binding NarL/FixJ family response regulator
LPIILTNGSKLDISDVSLYTTPITTPFQKGGFHFLTHGELFVREEDPITGELAFAFERQHADKVDHHRLVITGSHDSRHESTNEWGAMRLAHHFGLKDKATFSYPRHLYFKSLALSLVDGVVPEDNSLSGLFTHVLLIDDHAADGWQNLLEKILLCRVSACDPVREVSWQTRDFDSYDLIFLDLYLEGKPDKTLSLTILAHIKEMYPHIPVVIFTASEKAWNLDEVLEKGADGMYIKESPAHFKDEQYGKENFQDFLRTIQSVHEKYKVLRPYWEVIREILSNGTFQCIENNPKKMKDRLGERLKMFYGLLKKGHEQSDYDKRTFFYSDYELAFMTLWSCLNEIQEYQFQKISTSTHTHWKRPADSLYYIKYQAAQRGPMRKLAQFYTDLVNLPSWSAGAPAKKNKWSFEQQIRLQVTYIIERMNPVNRATLLTNLERLNRTRNALYLTHGSNNPHFFSSTEEDKRRSLSTMTPQGDIRDLFNIVAYVVTGDETLAV